MLHQKAVSTVNDAVKQEDEMSKQVSKRNGWLPRRGHKSEGIPEILKFCMAFGIVIIVLVIVFH